MFSCKPQVHVITAEFRHNTYEDILNIQISANNWQCISRFGWYEVEDWLFGDGHGATATTFFPYNVSLKTITGQLRLLDSTLHQLVFPVLVFAFKYPCSPH